MPPRNYYQSKKSNWSTGKPTSRSAGTNQGFNQFSRKSGPANITPKPVQKQSKSSFSFFPLIDAANKIIKSIPPIKVRPAKLPSTKPKGTKIVTTPTKDGKSKILTTPSPKGGSKIVTQNTVKRTYKNPYSGYTRPQSETFLKNTPKRNQAVKTKKSTTSRPAPSPTLAGNFYKKKKNEFA